MAGTPDAARTLAGGVRRLCTAGISPGDRLKLIAPADPAIARLESVAAAPLRTARRVAAAATVTPTPRPATGSCCAGGRIVLPGAFAPQLPQAILRLVGAVGAGAAIARPETW
ncbi:hypothetical protein [Rhizobium halophytocola]|uniref:AMP-dependent synthetase/ligase domain-containing protein n=1 Tax=Rhizobium halophytocola TaxID=735519 RepID=A0ABS4E5M0_9HYPH|nr:hypothetical protein [Rhizobium halophytocola]MBP1853245.1 hypothetical protein [Rhizobium halophytocola]